MTTTAPPAVPAPERTALATFESLTGFDEIAIGKAFDTDVTKLRKQPLMFLRSLVFVHHRRHGLKDVDAKRAALEMPIGELNTYFPPEPEDLDPEEPDSLEGKEPSGTA